MNTLISLNNSENDLIMLPSRQAVLSARRQLDRHCDFVFSGRRWLEVSRLADEIEYGRDVTTNHRLLSHRVTDQVILDQFVRVCREMHAWERAEVARLKAQAAPEESYAGCAAAA